GTPGMGTVKSAIGIGALLADGIGDTIRVSLTGDPEPEAAAALDILRALGLRGGVDVISCPTCGRTGIEVEGIAKRVQAATRSVKKNLRVAVMGCVVNGPGEAKEADVGIAGGRNGGILFMRGEQPVTIHGDAEALYSALMKEVNRLCAE
ncbi:MAG: flavodoxin-dependent (E)-4-hydroxy-3-methylbut-2-enyl-diphosphate synthase, partial [Clostridiales bacterium]|nr:flavodoxin-dependent (E)-4-hydroxy-3-methylbut-2-enyl-diphosphate synthase [Clostridiales bacterium]